MWSRGEIEKKEMLKGILIPGVRFLPCNEWSTSFEQKKKRKKLNRFRKVQNYKSKLGEVTCFLRADNNLLIFFGLKFTILNLWRIHV